MQFQDELAGGVTLVRPALQSPNYAAGTAGWRIAIDGSAEFSQLTIYSVAGTGEKVVVSSGQVSIYSATGQLLTTLNGQSGITNYSSTKFAQLSQGVLYLSDTAYYAVAANVFIGPSGLRVLSPQNVSTGTVPSSIDLQPGDTVGTASVTGKLTVTDSLTAPSLNLTSPFTAYTPTVTGGGTATFTSLTGWWTAIGKMVFFNASVVVNAAGSGASAVQVTTPTPIDRTDRQTFTAAGEGMYASGIGSTGVAIASTAGSGAVIDRIRMSNNSTSNADPVLTGANLAAGGQFTLQGWYRQP